MPGVTTGCTLSASFPASDTLSAFASADGNGVWRNTFTSATAPHTAAPPVAQSLCALAAAIGSANTGDFTSPNSAPVAASTYLVEP